MEQRRAAENREQLVEMKSVQWCVSFQVQLCPGVTSRVFRRGMTDRAEVEIGADLACL